jgi:hypothetical protein
LQIGAVMKYFRRIAWIIIIVGVFLRGSSASAAFDEFDAAVLIKKSFWKDIADVLPLAGVELQSGKVTLVAATLCEVRAGSARFLVAFEVADPKPASLAQGVDCNKSAADLVSVNPNAGYDGLAFVSVRQGNAGLEVAVSDVAVKPAATISTAVLQEVRSYKKTFALQNIDLGDEYTKDAEVFVNFLQDGLIVLIRDSAMAHALRPSDIQTDFVSSSGKANSELLISHDALSKIAADRLSKTTIPLADTGATIRITSYTGSVDKVSVQADVARQTYLFKGSATWSGSDLPLTEHSLKTQKDCSKQSGTSWIACEAVRKAEDAAADAMIGACSTCFFPAHVVPLTKDKKFKFEVYGRSAFFAAQTISAVSNAKALVVMLDSSVGAQH